jgi:hypothetical protein
MHNGRFSTIEDVVEFYNRGGDFPDQPNVDSAMRDLNLTTQQKSDLAAFLKRPLTDERVKQELPPFDRPKLYTESNRVPTVSGSGRTGTGGQTPNAIALEPPIVGNQSFTVAVSNALGSTPAVLAIGSTDPGVGATIPASAGTTGAGTGLGIGSGAALRSPASHPHNSSSTKAARISS